MEQDYEKLEHVLGYLQVTAEQRLVLSCSESNMHVNAYVDIAYALHQDSRSCTGVIVYVGNTLAHVSLRKQKCMTKSPTEAELVRLTNNGGMAEIFEEFVCFITN